MASLNGKVCFVLSIRDNYVTSRRESLSTSLQVKDLLAMPSQNSAISTVKIITSVGVAVAGVAIVSGIYLANKK